MVSNVFEQVHCWMRLGVIEQEATVPLYSRLLCGSPAVTCVAWTRSVLSSPPASSLNLLCAQDCCPRRIPSIQAASGRVVLHCVISLLPPIRSTHNLDHRLARDIMFFTTSGYGSHFWESDLAELGAIGPRAGFQSTVEGGMATLDS
jgi:hypothetical protein